jgi:hypothetical protein
VVVEYKKGADSGIVSQALSYLRWLNSAQHEFEALVRERLGAGAVGKSIGGGGGRCASQVSSLRMTGTRFSRGADGWTWCATGSMTVGC